MPLDRTIQELEARLPDLRHLIADGEMVLATSDAAGLLADELEFLLSRADTVAGRLRHLLLGGDLLDIMKPGNGSAVLPEATPKPPAENTPGSGSAPETFSELDEDLARALGLLPEQDLLTAPSEELQEEGTSEPGPQAEAEADLLSTEERQAYITQLEAMARQVVVDQDQIKNLWRELGLDRPDDDPDDLAGGAAVAARPNPPPTPPNPGAERTFEGVEEPPRIP